MYQEEHWEDDQVPPTQFAYIIKSQLKQSEGGKRKTHEKQQYIDHNNKY